MLVTTIRRTRVSKTLCRETPRGSKMLSFGMFLLSLSLSGCGYLFSLSFFFPVYLLLVSLLLTFCPPLFLFSIVPSSSRSERLFIGYTKYSKPEVREIYEEFKEEYLGPSYNVLDRNCNHFTQHFIKRLTKKELPAYVNRIMKVARKVRPCLPSMFKHDLRDQDAPPEYDSHKTHVPQPKDYKARYKHANGEKPRLA